MFDVKELVEEYNYAYQSASIYKQKVEEANEWLKAAEQDQWQNEQYLIGIEKVLTGLGHKLVHTEKGWVIR